jgi:hypothetical protein
MGGALAESGSRPLFRSARRAHALVVTLSLCGCTADTSLRALEDSGAPSTSGDSRPETGSLAADGAPATIPTACHDDRPVPGTQWQEGGASCTLPDGGAGIGSGAYGCIDRTACFCKPEAGATTCPTNGPCAAYTAVLVNPAVYATCSGANQDDPCALPGGGVGRCCAGVCRSLEYYLADSGNCGGCGFACAQGQQCSNGACGACSSLGLCGGCGAIACPAGRECVPAICRGDSSSILGSCHACVLSACANQPDGTACAIGGTQGMCCDQVCVNPMGDNRNCGGCGIACCPGVQCEPGSWFPSAGCTAAIGSP